MLKPPAQRPPRSTGSKRHGGPPRCVGDGAIGTIGGQQRGNRHIVVKTRLQGTKASQYTGTLDCFKKVLANEGVAAFYVGVVPRMGRVVPGQGIIFMSFETIQKTLEGMNLF